MSLTVDHWSGPGFNQLRFQTTSRPSQVTIEDFAKAKGEALASLQKHGALVVMYVVLHDLARSEDVHTMTERATR